jgi:small neutral amino acid transporter SnatA (MarC family)
MNELETLDAAFVIDTFLLLLIGIGPKIALVPFLDMTAGMTEATKRRVLRKMLTTAALVAALLLILGGLLTRLLHFSPGALGVASGIILLILAATMVLGQGNGSGGSGGGGGGGGHQVIGRDPMRVAVFPLAVPYLLNPAGIVVLALCRPRPAHSPCSASPSACSSWCSRSTSWCSAGPRRSAASWMPAGCW